MESEYFLSMPNSNLVHEIEDKINELQNIPEEKLKGILVRSRACNFKLNDKPSKLF